MDYDFFVLSFREVPSILVLPHKNNRIYLLWNCFSNFVYLKVVYVTLKGTEKIVCIGVQNFANL